MSVINMKFLPTTIVITLNVLLLFLCCVKVESRVIIDQNHRSLDSGSNTTIRFVANMEDEDSRRNALSRINERRSDGVLLVEQDNPSLGRPFSTTYFNSEQCPPLPIISKSELCQALKCNRDEDCRRHSQYFRQHKYKNRNHDTRTDAPSSSSSSGDDSEDLLCCFNGCIKSCVHKVDAPLAFDWVEETQLKFQYNNEINESNAINDDHDHTLGHFSQLSSSSNAEEENTDEVPEEIEVDGSSDDETPPTKMRTTTPGGHRHNIQPKGLLMYSKSVPETIVLPGGCFLKNEEYKDLLLFQRNNHVTSCSCINGDIVCEVNK